MTNFCLPYYCKSLPIYLSDRYYLNRIPSFLKEMIDEIEDNINFKIKVNVDKSFAHAYCEKNRGSAVIYFPSIRYFDVGPLIHELLHLKHTLC